MICHLISLLYNNKNNNMNSKAFELSVFVESISSFSLEKTVFHTVMLRAGSKKIQLPQKKSLTQTNLLSLLQKVTLRLEQNELDDSRNIAQIQVYSIQKYGKKKLLGRCQFQFELTNRREIKAEFILNEDQKAQIKFSYGFFKTESTLLSEKSYCSSASRKSNRQERNREVDTCILGESEVKPITEEAGGRRKHMQNMLSPTLFHDQTTLETCRTGANAQIPQKSKLVPEHFENQEECSKKEGQNFARLSSLNTTNPQLSRFDLQLQSRVIQFSAISQQQSQSETKKAEQKPFDTPRALRMSDSAQRSQSGNQSYLNQSPDSKKQDKMRIIRPKNKIQSFQQWADDDNLVNILHQMLNDAKGNLGYIKLSKLTLLTKIITQAKNTNRRLSVANSTLLQNQRYQQQKIEELEQTIKDREERYPAQLDSLRKHVKEAEKKLVDRYSQELFRDKKLKQAQAKMLAYQRQIKDLQGQLQTKAKQVQHLRALANSYQEPQNPAIEPKEDPTSFSKQLRFKRSSSNNIFKSESSDSKRKNQSSSQKEKSQIMTSCPIISSSRDATSGINPDFIEFFTSFRGKNAKEVGGKEGAGNEHQSLGLGSRRLGMQMKQREEKTIKKEQSIEVMSQQLFEI